MYSDTDLINALISLTKCREDIAELLNKGVDIEGTDFQGNTPLRRAAWEGKTDMVRFLLSRGARDDVSIRDGYSPLLAAARNGHTEVCQVLVKHGSNLQQQHPLTRDSALSNASSGGHHSTLLALLSLGAGLDNRAITGFTPLAVAAQNGHLAVVVSLLQAGADPRHMASGLAVFRFSGNFVSQK